MLRQSLIEHKKPVESLSGKAKRISQGATYGSGNWKIPQDSYQKPKEIYYYPAAERKGVKKGEHKHEQKEEKTEVIKVISKTDSQNTAHQHIEAKLRPAVQNPANSIYKGGAAEQNYGTLEESLAFTTNLLSGHLYSPDDERSWHGRHKYSQPLQHGNFPDKGPNALYSKGVYCFARANSPADTFRHDYKECEPFQFDVFTSCGFDLRRWGNDHTLFEGPTRFDWDLFTNAMQMKYELFFETALRNDNDSVVSCALGCGAFIHYSFLPQNTYDAVATAYARAVNKYQHQFKRIDIVALDQKLATTFDNKLKNMQSLGPGLTDADRENFRQNAFFHNDRMLIDSVYQKLVDLTYGYLKDHKGIPIVGGDLNCEKWGVYNQLWNSLTDNSPIDNSPTDNSPKTTQAKKQAIEKFQTALTELTQTDKTTLQNHRSPTWARYVYNALSILTVLPMLSRAITSYFNYGTLRFWQSDSQKRYGKISADVDKLQLKPTPSSAT